MKYVVTGGGGFLGRALCLRLCGEGHEVVSVSRSSYPDLADAGVRCLRADISAPAGLWGQVFAGADAVFHTAAKVEMWGRYRDFFGVNVVGTRNLLELCRMHGVRKLVYTSSPSVVADGTNLRGVNEKQPYPRKHAAHYPATKAIAEREVLAANGADFYTLALRPHLIWGPGDTNLVPTILERARAGRLVRVGRGNNLVDLCYIDDCVEAHLCAARALDENPAARGRAFFISQGRPVRLWQWIDEVLKRNGLPPVKRSLPVPAAMAAAALCEWAARLTPGRRLPLLTRFLVSEMATDHYFDISAAERELGWRPRHTIAQGLERAFPQALAA